MTDRNANRSRRGHQYHPKNIGNRGTDCNVPTTEIIQALREGRNLETLFNQQILQQCNNPAANLSTNSLDTNTAKEVDGYTSKGDTEDDFIVSEILTLSSNKRSSRGSDAKKKKIKIISVSGAGGGGLDDIENIIDEDAEMVELSKLRCTSERTEVIAEREHRRQKKCSDYPGLAFGRSIFSSDSMMKFNIIRNELQNIMNNQLRRVRTISKKKIV